MSSGWSAVFVFEILIMCTSRLEAVINPNMQQCEDFVVMILMFLTYMNDFASCSVKGTPMKPRQRPAIANEIVTGAVMDAVLP